MLPFLIAVLLLAPDPAVTGVRGARVRPLSDIMKAIVGEARRRSATIQQLIDDLQRLDTIVYLEMGFEQHAEHGTTSILATGSGVRMLRVVISARLAPARRIEILGHELAHALELARAPDVIDGPTFREFYSRIGYAISGTAFETDAARTIEQRIRSELSGRQ